MREKPRARSACEPSKTQPHTGAMDLVTEALGDAARLILDRDPELLRIAGLSVAVSGAAAILAALLGVPLGAALHLGRLPGRRPLTLAVNTGMGLPPVVVGLAVTLLLWRTGPLGALRLCQTRLASRSVSPRAAHAPARAAPPEMKRPRAAARALLLSG